MAKKRKSAGRKAGAKRQKTVAKRKKSTAKRTLIAPRGDKRYVRRNSKGEFNESDNVSRSLSSDRRRKAKRKAPKGQRDRGD